MYKRRKNTPCRRNGQGDANTGVRLYSSSNVRNVNNNGNLNSNSVSNTNGVRADSF